MREDITFAHWLSSIAIDLFLQEYKAEKKPAETHMPVSNNELENKIYSLPEEQRIVFVLHDLEQYPAKNIAEFFEISEEEINVRLSSARAELQIGDKNDLNSLPKKIEPDHDLWQGIFSKIHEIKVIQGQEEEELAVEIEETEEEKEQRRLMKEELKQKQKEEKREALKSSVTSFTKTAAFKGLIVGVILVAAVVFVYMYFFGGPSWEVLSTSGTPSISGKTMSGVELLEPNEFITTNQSSTVNIKIPEIGEIEVLNSSVIYRLTGKNRMRLEKGKIKVHKNEAKELLTVEIPAAEVKDYYLGGDYNLEVEPNGKSLLYVKESWVYLSGEVNSAFVLPGYRCEVDKEKGVGLPYHRSSSESFRNAIAEFSFKGGSEEKLNTILSLADARNTVALWHLLKRVGDDDRYKIYTTMYGLSKPPDGVTQEGILSLNENMMERWLQDLQFIK